ncbi:hypothetical protein [Roseibium sp. Sym1]|uniref:hypothetical protein n=1 Tax=Roseibium sp. Sym1 TaxID=3016006 RepID=UPI0022B38FF3|nr:hypothetical protein [Roseibium sp. Sym1]
MSANRFLEKLLGVMLLLAAILAPGAPVQATGVGAPSTCAAGEVMDQLVVVRDLSLTGADAAEMAGLYDAFFQVMRQCETTGNLDFTVKLEWADKFLSRLIGTPELPDYTYKQRVSASNELCLSRKGMESALVSAPEWYCEKTGWVDKI